MNKECQVCFSNEKSKLFRCDNCNKLVCKFCKPTSEHACFSCVRSKIREEVIAESITKKRSLERQLLELMDSAQHTQLELECLSDKHFELENFLKSSMISHLEKLNNLQLAIEKAKKDVIPYSTIDNLELVVDGIKKSEKEKKLKLQELTDLVEAEEITINSQKELEALSEERIKDLKFLSSNCVPYEDIRGMVCESCSKAIKGRFREMIVTGNSGNESILKSVISKTTNETRGSTVSLKSMPTRKSNVKIDKTKDKNQVDACSCISF